MKTKIESKQPLARIETLILTMRSQKVILDSDLARIYGVTTARLNEQVRRNIDRFPEDFCFQLSSSEWTEVRSLRSQNATLEKGRGKHRKYLPYLFTEHGAIMAANVLKSKRAVQMSVFVVRAFIKMRSTLGDTRDLARKLAKLEKELKDRLGVHEAAIVDVLQRIMRIIDPPPEPEPTLKRRIGFGVEEPKVRYRVKRKTKRPTI